MVDAPGSMDLAASIACWVAEMISYLNGRIPLLVPMSSSDPDLPEGTPSCLPVCHHPGTRYLVC